MRFARNALAALVGLLACFLVACQPLPGPSKQSMNDFATKVISTAAAGDPGAVEKLAAADAADTGPQADALVSFAKGWNSATDKLTVQADFPSYSHVTATKSSGSTAVYEIAWLDDHWILDIGKRTTTTGASPRATP